MDRITSHARGNADEKNEQAASLRRAYEVLCELRDATAQNKKDRPSAAGLDDITVEGLLVLAAMRRGAAAPVLIQRLGITGQAARQLLETLIQRGYLEFRDNPGDPRRRTVSFTSRGSAVLDQAEADVIARRWAEFPFRSGDIVISTAPKSGTTWMQMICALLIFQTPSLSTSLPKLSPWLDEQYGRAEIYAELADQQHRRFIKTHIPLNAIPIDPRVTYIVVARNPLDIAVSWYYQTSISSLESSRRWLLDRIDEMGTYPNGRNSFDLMLRNLASAWEWRAKPNVVFVHYEDLSADLSGEMHKLASLLEITVPEEKWPALVRAATFKEMRAVAENLQPLNPGVNKGNSPFFRNGSSGEGGSLLAADEIARYYARAAQVAPRDLLAWLHRENERLCAGRLCV